MSETKTKFNEEHFAKHYSKEIDRMTAIIHINELASKNQIIHDLLLGFHAEVLEFANNSCIKVSKINSNDIVNTLHDRANGSIHDGGNGIMADL